MSAADTASQVLRWAPGDMNGDRVRGGTLAGLASSPIRP